MSTFSRVDHVVVAVEEVDRALGQYARLLGRRPSWRGEHPGEGSENVLFRLSNSYLELLAPVGKGPLADLLRQRLETQGEGPVALALGTDDAAASHAQLRDRGLAVGELVSGVGRDVESGAYRRWQRIPISPQRTRGVHLFGIQHQSPDELLPLAPPLGDEGAAVDALDHVVVRSGNPDASRALYGEEGLGIRLALDREFPQWNARMLFFRLGGATIEVVSSLNSNDTSPPPDRDELWGLAFRVPDAEATHARLVDYGVAVSGVRDGRKPGTRVFTVKEPGPPVLMLEAGAA